MRLDTVGVLLVVAVCCGGLAVGGVTAQQLGARSPETTTAEPGATVEVTVTVTAADDNIIGLNEELTTGAAHAEITTVDSSQGEATLTDGGAGIEVAYLDESDLPAPVGRDTLTYTIAIAPDAPETTVELGGTALALSEANDTTTGTTTITIDGDADDGGGSSGAGGSDSGDSTDSDSDSTGSGLPFGENTDTETDTAADSDTPTTTAPTTPAPGDEAGTTTPAADGPSSNASSPASTPQYVPGETVTVQITVRNTGGPAEAANVTVTEVPAGLILVDDPTVELTDRLAALNEGTAVGLPYQVRIAPDAAPGTYDLGVTLTLVGSDGASRNATTTVPVVVSATETPLDTDGGTSPPWVGLVSVGAGVLLSVVGGLLWRRRQR